MGITLLLALNVWAVDTVKFSVPKGASTIYVAEQLEAQGIIKYPTLFRIYMRVFRHDGTLRSGTFELSPEYSYGRIVQVLQEKEGAANLVSITVPEGYTLREIAQTLASANVIEDADSFYQYAITTAKADLIGTHGFLEQVPTTNLEGYFFPETYTFAQGVPHKQIVDKFLAQFEANILPIWQNHPHKMGLHNAMTLASIVEKESYDVDEMPLIAGVFHNRLRKRMQLGSCPTVGYGMGQPRKLVLTYDDLKYPSPYNTYIHRGLPPTPIASMGKKAFMATVQPKKTDYLYFVSKGDGNHEFNDSYNDHLNDQQKILTRQKK